MFRLLVENVVDYAIFVVDPEGLVRTWSHGAERLLGYREGEILGRTADVFYTPEDVEDHLPQRERQEALATGRGDDNRWHVRKDGTRFWASGVMTPLVDEAGKLRGFAKIMRDRTEWWHAEQARLEGEGRFRTTFAHASVGMAVTDAEGRFLDANRAYCEITGYSLEELLPKDLASLTHPDDLPKNLGLIRRMLDGGDPGFVIEKRLSVRTAASSGSRTACRSCGTRGDARCGSSPWSRTSRSGRGPRRRSPSRSGWPSSVVT